MSPRILPSVLMLAVAAAATGTVVSSAPAATTPETTPATSTTPTPTPTPTPAPNPTPPTVVTSGVQSLSRTGATLTGAVTPGNAETRYHFQYGTTSGYGLTTPDQTVPAGSSAVPVTHAITGLTVGTTYHYRITATNAAGAKEGADKTFSTQANPKAPTVSTLTATALTATTAQLNARVNPQGQPTMVSFQYGTSTKYGSWSTAISAGAGTSTVTSSIAVAGLAGNTKYHYRAIVQNGTGSARGSDHTFTTPRGLTGVGLTIVPQAAVFGSAAVVSGTVGGAGVGGVTVQLLQQDFPFTGTFRQVATQVSSSAGAYSFSISPVTSAIKLQVVTQTTVPVTSPVATLRVSLYNTISVKKRSRTAYTLRATVNPQIHNGTASVQRRTPKGRWITVKHARLSDFSTTASKVKTTVSRLTRTTRYRIKFTPHDGGAHVITTSASVSVPKRS